MDELVTGSNKKVHRRENKRKRISKQENQAQQSYWRQQNVPPGQKQGPENHRGGMCHYGLALHHPASATLWQYATGGRPTLTGQTWTRKMIEAAIKRGSRVSALDPAVTAQFQEEAKEKQACGQCRLISCDAIKNNLPAQLKVSPIAVILHK